MRSILVLFHVFAVFVPAYYSVAQTVVWDTQIEGSNTFSSARAVDLTEDGIPDIVIGCGRELADTSFGVFAFDGVSGEVLWSVKTRSQIFGSPIFQDVSNDGIADVVIGGRRNQLYCIDGFNGEVIWEVFPCSQLPDCFADSLPNFYSGQWLEDLNGDAVPEILNILGGYAPANANDANRPPASIVIIDGATGEILRQYEMPDGKESYNSPVLWNVEGISLNAVFGSGGETVGGSLWAVSIGSLWEGTPEFIQLASSESKGFMAPVSMADFDDDGSTDLAVMGFDGMVSVISGADRSVLWAQNHFPGNESSAVPCILHFDDDGVPDVAVNLATGVFPFYSGGFHAVLSGIDGSVLWQSGPSAFPFHSALAFRAENEVNDRLVIVRNQIGAQNQLSIEMVRSEGLSETLLSETGSVDLASTPLLLDFEGSGALNIVVVSTTHPSNPFSEDNMRVRRLSTNISIGDAQVSWGGYMGTNGDGLFASGFIPPVGSGIDLTQKATIRVIPNPFNERITIQAEFMDGDYLLTDLTGRIVVSGTFNREIDLASFSGPYGIYLLHLRPTGGWTSSVVRVVRNN